MTAPVSISDTYQIDEYYLQGPGTNSYLCLAELGKYFAIPAKGAYSHFRFYQTDQPGTIRVDLVDWVGQPCMVLVLAGNTNCGKWVSHQLPTAVYCSLLNHFASANTRVLYVELCEGPFDKDCNTLPESVQYPHVEITNGNP